MRRFGEIIAKQSHMLLENKQQAILCAVVFAILPFTLWLSVALVVLFSLRKGIKAGFELLLPAVIIHLIPLMMLVPMSSAFVDTFIAYFPCFFAAIILRTTRSWNAVFGVILLQACIGAILFQSFVPDYIINQFNLFKTLLAQHQEYQQIFHSSSESLNSGTWAQLFFGVQIITVVIINVIPLMLARSIQSRLFNPGGFENELLAFRSGKTALIALIAISLGSYYEIALALNLLPLIIVYFLLSGFSLAYFIFARKRQMTVAALLFLLILLSPPFVLFAYVIVGSLDSIFNFRLYLPARECT